MATGKLSCISCKSIGCGPFLFRKVRRTYRTRSRTGQPAFRAVGSCSLISAVHPDPIGIRSVADSGSSRLRCPSIGREIRLVAGRRSGHSWRRNLAGERRWGVESGQGAGRGRCRRCLWWRRCRWCWRRSRRRR